MQLTINRVAVLGAGVMGAQIAALCVNAGFQTDLYDLAAPTGEPNGIVNKAIAQLAKLKPSPLGTSDGAMLLTACNYDHDLARLKHVDLIIEAIAERLDWKEALYARIAPHVSAHAILVSNTSGLNIHTLSSVLPASLRKRFCGVHFFNPPRYMHLAELIPSDSTEPALLDQLETFLTSYLGKGVVRAHDTPNFIANRIGVFSLLITMHRAAEFGIGLDIVDALTGPLLGRPKSATFRTMDVVGLDTMAHVVKTMHDQLKEDPWHALFQLPPWLDGLIQAGYLGQKTGQGIYRKPGKQIEVYDLILGGYRPAEGHISDEVKAIFQIADPKQRMQRLAHASDQQAKFVFACLRDLFHYCAFHLQTIAASVRDVDLAMRWGFGWIEGPFETWQKAGVFDVKTLIDQSIHHGTAAASIKLPTWLETLHHFYTELGAFSPDQKTYQGRSQLSVYKKQIMTQPVLAETAYHSETVYENEGITLWRLRSDVWVASFKSKANTISQSVLDGLNHALDLAQGKVRGLIIYQHQAQNFSSGADLRAVAELIHQNKIQALSDMIHSFQQVALRLKYCAIPVIAAVRGRALGGGCELMMQCSRIMAGFESYPGLVEVGVGLIPAGGGCKEMAIRAASEAQHGDLFPALKSYFEQIATATVAGSAADGLRRGYLQAHDAWIMHQDEVLSAALAMIEYLHASNYRPPLAGKFPVAGIEGRARLQVGLVNWLAGGFISEHDYFIANELATVLCGGEVNQGTLVDESWMLNLELDAFLTLAQTEKTQARIKHILETGKPLRN